MITLSNIPTHQLAQFLLQAVRDMLAVAGLSENSLLEESVYTVLVVALALSLSWIVRMLILFVVGRLKLLRGRGKAVAMHYQKLLRHCIHIVSPLVILALLPFAFNGITPFSRIIHVGAMIYLIVTFAIAISAGVNFAWERFNVRGNTRNLPLAGIRNLCIGIVWAISAIVIGSVMLDKSPVALLTGLGAFATVLMLVFRDSILGFVAGLQLSQNDMVRIGDWIVVPSTIANGIVEDMSLSTVKVRNWDNTIVMLPPYTLVSTSFQNWRGMSDSGSRLISRSVTFCIDSVTSVTDDVITEVSALLDMQKYIERVKATGQYYDNGLACVNGTLQSNLGLFRAYMCQYLLHHPQVNTAEQILVRIMPMDDRGVPLQIYCYTSTDWTVYEAVQSEILEHLIVAAQNFGLQPYSTPSSEDVRFLRPNANTGDLEKVG